MGRTLPASDGAGEPAPRGFLLTIAYDGGPFSGWAPQPAARTVAGEVLGALRTLDPAIRELRGASRTDAGVHARGQLAAFDATRDIPPRGWALGLAAGLPAEIAIRAASRVPAGSSPRFASVRKRYRYLVLRDRARDPFWEGRAWRLAMPLDVERARGDAAAIVGTHDFRAFRAAKDDREETVRTIERVALGSLDGHPRVLAIEVTGTAFLYNMVRIIAGTLVDVARGHLAPGATTRALASGRREDLGATAPPHGLYLEAIEHSLATSDAWPGADDEAGEP